MPELPDIVNYCEALHERIVGSALSRVRVLHPFVLRTVDPPIDRAEGRVVQAVTRLGKRVVIHLDQDLALVIHLMIAGRLQWRDAAAAGAASKPPGRKQALFELAFSSGSLFLTEAGSKRRASLHCLQGDAALAAMDPGGLEVLDCDFSTFQDRVTASNHTLKRVLTDPHARAVGHRQCLFRRDPASRRAQPDDADAEG